MFSATNNSKGMCEVILDGELTIYEASQLMSEFNAQFENFEAMTINLEAVSEIDTACFQVLVMAKIRCSKLGKEFSMNSHSTAVSDVLELLNMENFFGDPVLV